MASVTRVTTSTYEARVVGAVVLPMRPLEALDDAALVRAVLDGTPRAPTVFFDRYAVSVERFLRRLLGPDGDVAEALNEVFLRALDRLDSVTEPSGMKTWLHSIAIYVAKERRRRNRRWSLLEVRPWDFFRDFAPAADAAPLEEREALRRVYALLDRLGDDDRTLFVLRFIDELELTEVATLRGISLASAKRHIARAQKKFFALAGRDPSLLHWLERDSHPIEVPS